MEEGVAFSMNGVGAIGHQQAMGSPSKPYTLYI